ncbi:hydroxycarboxylic acid receptor 2-like [Mobula hypostoma]|uniref:hydroxycarboxylic acid receptor 2-like n=1 Tax=Mobula hypostoma TaxID=723540 RepID=UPI002FC2F923
MGNVAQACSAENVDASYNPPVIIVTFVLGFVTNATALWIFCFHVKTWTPNTVYSLNLAIADSVLICCLPFRADYFVRGKDWIYGDVPCRLKVFMISLNRVGSIIFLMVIAIDRYFKVVHPLHKVNKLPTSCATKIAGALWIAAVAICLHLLIERHDFQHNNVTNCEPFKINHRLGPTAIWTYTVFIVLKFILPFSVIVFSTSSIIWKLKQMETEIRSKYKRAAKLVTAVALVFLLCFLPTNVAVVAVLITKLRTATDCRSYVIAVDIFHNTLFVTYFNSVLDPVIYYFSSSAFKNILKKSFHWLQANHCSSGTDETVTSHPK